MNRLASQYNAISTTINMCGAYLKLLVVFLSIAFALTEQCTSPTGKAGKCVPLKSCPSLQDAFQNPRKGSDDYLRKFICAQETKGQKLEQDDKEFLVCCGPSTKLAPSEEESDLFDATKTSGSKVKLGGEDECGRIHSVFCSSSTETLNVPVVPWLVKVLIADATNNAYATCSGSLINHRYVITGAQCINGTALKNGDRIVVRFGEKYIANRRNPEEECADLQYFETEEVIVHPFYHPPTQLNDVALLRLNKTVLDKALYRPICLSPPSNFHAKPDDYLGIPRWNEPLTNGELAPKQCKQMFENININGSATTHDIVPLQFRNAVPIAFKGDVGSPVMFNRNDKWYLEGMVSRNANCENGQPGSYTKVTDYQKWIEESVKPWSAEKCTTPEGRSAQCIELSDCPTLLSSSTNPTKAITDHLRKHVCEEGEFYGTFRVCCDPSLSFSVSTTSVTSDNNDSIEISDLKQCGIQDKGDNSISTDDFPWLARIMLPGDNYTQCLGSLINGRYILTEAWCSYDLPNNAVVRLGESSGAKENGGFEDFGIEEAIIHPFFVYWSRLNNLALLRLNKTVSYTDYIRPICLPIAKSSKAKLGDTLYTSGWDYNAPEKGITKKKVPSNLVATEQCSLPFVKPVAPYSICTSILTNGTEVSCFGDNGGPLMHSKDNQWYIQGVVSTLDCNNNGQQVHTDVESYLDWIRENIKTW